MGKRDGNDGFRAAVELLDKPELSQFLLNQVPAFIVLLNQNFEFIHFNKYAEELSISLFGKKCKQGDHLVDFFPETGKQKLKENLEKIKQGKRVKDVLVYDLSNHKKAYYRYEIISSEIDSENLYVLSGSDASEEIVYEKEQSELDELLHKIIDSVSSSITVINADGEILGVNESYCKLSGYSREELMGLKVWNLTTEEDARMALVDFEFYMNTGLYPQRTYKLIKKDGSTVDVIIRSKKKTINNKLYIITSVTDVSEMKSLQRELEVTLARNSAIMNNVDVYLWSLDKELRYIEANDLTKELLPELFNYKFKKGDLFWNRYNNTEFKSRPYWEDNLNQVLKDERPRNFEFTEVIQGKLIHKSVKLFPIHNKKGELEGINCQMVIDTDEYLAKICEDALTDFKARLSTINKVNDLLWAVTDEVLSKLYLEDALILVRQGKNLKVKTAYGKLRGKGRAVHSGLTIKIGQGITGMAVQKKLALVVNDVKKDEYYFSEHFEEANAEIAVPIIVRGEVYGIINCESSHKNFFHPIHLRMLKEVAVVTASHIEQIRSTNQLVKMESLNRTILNSTPISFFLINKSHRIESFNTVASKEVFRFFGKTIRKGYQFINLVEEKDQKEFKERFQEVLEGDSFSTEMEVDVKQKKIWLNIRMSPAENKRGEIFGVTLTAEDITPRKVNERLILAKNKELKKANSELDQFVYSASHDLRGPVSRVLGVLNLINDTNKPEELEEYLGMIRTATQQQDQIIRNIIDYSRSNKVEPVVKEVCFNKLVDDVLVNISKKESLDGINITRNISASNKVLVDEERCKIILSNLISNAVVYSDKTKASRNIAISFNSSSGEYEISVKDNGVGIEKKYVPRIFDMFFTANAKPKGSGLGLYILNEAVNMLNGRVSVKSEIGVGSEFSVRLPIPTLKSTKNEIIVS